MDKTMNNVKHKILLLFLVFLISIVPVYGQFCSSVFLFNPFTGKQDRVCSLNQSGGAGIFTNVTADFFFGNGSQLTGITATVDDDWVNITGDTLQGSLDMDGNVIGNVSTLFIGNSNDNQFIYFYAGGNPKGKSLSWDKDFGWFSISDTLRGTSFSASGQIEAGSNIFTPADIFTTGVNGDFWLGNSVQSSANFRASADGTVEIDADNKNLYIGEGQDAIIYYDGTDMIIRPDEVGTGILIINGTTQANDHIILANDKVYIQLSENHFIRSNASEEFGTISEESIWLQHNESHAGGTILFLLSHQNNTNFAIQSGINTSGSILGNSLMVQPNSLTKAMGGDIRNSTNCLKVCAWYNVTCYLNCDTGGYGASLLVQGGAHIFRQLFVGEKSQFDDAIDIFSKGDDINIVNASLHVRKERREEIGLGIGEQFDAFTEDFDDGTLDPFVKIDQVGSDTSNWLVVSDLECDNDQCARAQGGNSQNVRTMETNVSLVNTDVCNLSFTYTTNSLTASDLLNVTLNNLTDGVETTFFSTSTDAVSNITSALLTQPYFNVSKVTLRFRFNAQNALRQTWINDIFITCNSTISTKQNVTRVDTEFQLGNGNQRIFWNGSTNILELPANRTAGDVTETSLNVTESIFTVNITISDTITLGDDELTSWDAVNITDHSLLDNLDFESSGHTGFQDSASAYGGGNFTEQYALEGYTVTNFTSDLSVVSWTGGDLSGTGLAATVVNTQGLDAANITSGFFTDVFIANDITIETTSRMTINNNTNITTNGNVEIFGNFTTASEGFEMKMYVDPGGFGVIKVT